MQHNIYLCNRQHMYIYIYIYVQFCRCNNIIYIYIHIIYILYIYVLLIIIIMYLYIVFCSSNSTIRQHCVKGILGVSDCANCWLGLYAARWSSRFAMTGICDSFFQDFIHFHFVLEIPLCPRCTWKTLRLRCLRF